MLRAALLPVARLFDQVGRESSTNIWTNTISVANSAYSAIEGCSQPVVGAKPRQRAYPMGKFNLHMRAIESKRKARNQ